MKKGNIIITFLYLLGIGYLINKFGIFKFLIGGLVLAVIVAPNATGPWVFGLMIYGIYKFLTK